MKTIIFLILFISTNLFARPLTLEQKQSDLNELVGFIKTGYGPLHYKKINYGIDVDVLKDKYSFLINETKTNSEFYYLMVKFVAEFNDSHFGANLPTDYVTTLGFNTDLVQGKILIDDIDREKLPKEKFPFEKGDEIVSLDGQLIDDVLVELVSYMGQGFELTAKRKAAQLIVKRKAFKVPARDGKSIVEIRRGDSKVTEKIELDWISKGNYTDEFIPTVKNKNNQFHKAKIDYDNISIEESFRCSGESRIKKPKDAIVIMEKPFVAYYYPTAKGNIGYLRIPHYSPEETDKTINAHELRFRQYEYAVSMLEKNTVGLIIDQDHNCGGSVAWLHRFLTLFIQKPFPSMQFELLANKESYLDFESWMKEENEFTLDRVNAKTVLDLIKDTWLNTNNFLTIKTPIAGNTTLYPNPISYTKPIIVLIDEMSGSGGDAFPSMMQGLGRAKLLGTRTMGAGGHVINLPPLTNSMLTVRMTKSLFYRPDEVAVENNGAHPDIEYSPTINDFKYGYLEYQKFFTDKILELL
jgi:C-terminal processing protease CtpA/Prc